MNNLEQDVKVLNNYFSADVYINLSTNEKISFKVELMATLDQVRQNYSIKLLTKEDVLKLGLQVKNRTAVALDILIEKSNQPAYDKLTGFKDMIVTLRQILMEELFGGKQIFYILSDKTIGLDPSYVPFFLGEEYCKHELNFNVK